MNVNNERHPCILCGRLLESVFGDGDWSTCQPYAGGEIRFVFSYGSVKFDDAIGTTEFRGVICDECAEGLVDKMERLTPSMEPSTVETLPATKQIIEKLVLGRSK